MIGIEILDLGPVDLELLDHEFDKKTPQGWYMKRDFHQILRKRLQHGLYYLCKLLRKKFYQLSLESSLLGFQSHL